MLEGLAAWVLNTYLGQYLENLNTDQLSIGLLKGEVELENVPLRKDALRHLDMSIEVRAGFVGKVKLQIPLARLRSEPWIIAFEQLYLVAGPINLNEYDEEAEESIAFGRKMSDLDSIEAIWRSQHESFSNDGAYGSSYSSWLSYGTSFITNIIENIQLKIQDVHIRYEDNQSKPMEIFAFGITIESLTLQSSDQHWIPKFIYASDKSMSYKLLELKNLGIYCDTAMELYSNKSLGELAALMVSSINGKDHDYIIDPVSATACIKRNMSAAPLRSRSIPRFTCDLKLDIFPILLNDLQYSQIISSHRLYDRLERLRPYRKWRPRNLQIKGNAKEWWQYAIQCHLDKIQRKYQGRSWAFAFERAKALSSYVSIYCEHLRNPIKVSVAMQKHKSEVEQDLSFEELRLIREACMEKVASEFMNQQSGNKTTASPMTSGGSEGLLQAWFPAWGGWYSSEEPQQQIQVESEGSSEFSDNKSLESQKVTSQLEEEILYVISDSIENNTFMKRDAVFAHLSFSLKKGNVTISRMKARPHCAPRESSPQPKGNCSPMFVLEFSNVKVAFESRPRNQSFTFDLELGSVSLRDQVTERSFFPLLISQQRDPLNAKVNRIGLGPSLMYTRLSSMILSVSRLSGSGSSTSTSPVVAPGPLFSLSYEKKPCKSTKVDHRLVIMSQALDIIYNQRAFAAITDFFSPLWLKTDENHFIRSWTSTAHEKYEELKQQTKDEIKKNWETVIQGLMTMERKHWDIQLDISAPQIIIPEDLEDENATLVVLDFGKLVFCSSQREKAGNADQISNSDDEDAFATPCSTPEEFHLHEEPPKSTFGEEEPSVTQTIFHQHLYDKFDLKLCDIQVLVAKVKDNWRFACQKGTGPMHVIDRFNISLRLEHRVLEIIPEHSTSGDSQWPHLTLSGSLPQLVVHINEQKVQAIRNISAMYLRGASLSSGSHSGTSSMQKGVVDMGSKPCAAQRTTGKVSIPLQPVDPTEARDVKDGGEHFFMDGYERTSRLIVMQFNVDKLSIELQSRRRSVAELQVTGVRAQVSKRTSDISASLSVHSLLLVDALQTFGSDFELLVASHKHISMDSVSGSLLDSDPCSPTSPASPDASMTGKPTSPHALSRALNSLAYNRAHSPIGERSSLRSPSEVVSPVGYLTSSFDIGKDSEALINIEITYIGAEALTTTPVESRQNEGSYLFCSVEFNVLDVIANQETVVELVGFIHQLFSSPLQSNLPPQPPPSSESTAESAKPFFYEPLAGLYSPNSTSQNGASPSMRAEFSFDFHKLTILLLRAVMKDKDLVGRKVGTAVLSHAKIEGSIVDDILTWQGFLAGFQVRDVTPEGNKHQCIVSVGHDPIVESSENLVSALHSGVYHPQVDPQRDSRQRAFSFKVVRPLLLLSTYEEARRMPSAEDRSSRAGQDSSSDQSNRIYVQLHLASVCYTHSPQFLEELKSCANEFKQYMSQVAFSIKQAATEMAIGLVSKRIESFSTLSSGTREASPRHFSHLRHPNLSKSTDTLIFPQPPPASTLDSASLSPSHGIAPDLSFNTEVDIILETPIVVLPESSNSSNVLVAHLGQISIKNKNPGSAHLNHDAVDFLPIRTVAFDINVNDISFFALNVDERLRSRDITFHPLSATMMNAEELYSCREHGMPILHSTSLELTLTQRRDAGLLTEYEAGLVFPFDIHLDAHALPSPDSFTLQGGFIAPLKVSVSRHQYQLICQAVANMSQTGFTKGEANFESGKMSHVSEENNEGTTPSMLTTATPQSHVLIKGLFTIPSLCMELRGDACQMEEPLVNLVLKEISATYETSEPLKSNLQITLRSLVLEDLQLSDPLSGHHILMKSENVDPTPFTYHSSHPRESSAPLDIPTRISNDPYVSSSCPEARGTSHPPMCSASLPTKLEMEKPFYKMLNKSCAHYKRKNPGMFLKEDTLTVELTKSKDVCPSTPPPSPHSPDVNEPSLKYSSKDGALVNISIHTVDPKCPEFLSKYDGNVRFVDITLNSLVTVVNLESWVMLLDFFRSPAKDEEAAKANEDPLETLNQDIESNEESRMVLEVQLRSLTLVLNRESGEMAKAAVNQVWVRSVGSAGDLTLTGRLGSLSLIDLTPYGQHYRQKFLTVGTEAMGFQLFRYSTEDPSLLRNCDIRLKLKMSSIMYVHSHRFLQELTQFFLQFLFLRDKLSDWRAARAGLKVNERRHGTRISLDISAGSPIIFIPMWNCSDKLLTVDLGSLSVSNKILWSGTPGTISKVRRTDLFDRLASSSGDGFFRSRSGSLRSRSRSGSAKKREGGSNKTSEDEGSSQKGQKCLLDVMQLSLVNMDFFRSQRVSSLSRKQAKSESEQNVWEFDSFCVVRKSSSLLTDKCALILQVERNLDGEMSRIVPDFSIHGRLTKLHAMVDVTTYELVRGLLAHNLGEPVPEMELQPSFLSLRQAAKPHPKVLFPASHIWTTLNIHLDLDDVIVEAELTDLSDEEEEKESENPSFDSVPKMPFARINFIKSKLLYESFSDSSRDVDLVSQEIVIGDTRFQNFPANKRSNVFSNILIPAKDKHLKNANPLQVEVHYRSTRDVTRFTVLLNNMRLMAIMDWWKTAQTFIQSAPPSPPVKGVSESNAPVSDAFSCAPPHVVQEPPPKSKANLLRLNPMVESTGLMTKHSLIADDCQVPFELKINITDSEMVIVEKSSEWDTLAVILKTTAVVSYRPHFQERPVSCNLNQCELYSCTLGLEEETALSIIDPVTINIEVNDRTAKDGVTDIANIAFQNEHMVEISLHQLNIRLSYHDIKMFQRILESIPKQKEEATSRKSSRILAKEICSSSTTGEPANFAAQVEQLSVLGFSKNDCLRGLKACFGRLDEAALWLTQNAQPQPDFVPQDHPSSQQDNGINLRGFELKTGSINVTIIDDCDDCDVPLLEVSFLHLGVKQDREWKGAAEGNLSIDYYNRSLSGWEPFVEPWKCSVEWKCVPPSDHLNRKFLLSLKSEGIVNVSITNTLLDLYRLVRDNWTEDYYNRENLETETERKRLRDCRGSPQRGQRRRTPFVPFALQNDTGCDLQFYPLVHSGRKCGNSELILGTVSKDQWRNLPAGKTMSFAFQENASKQRHSNSHSMKSHQLIVKVGSWNPVDPVTVDKVGVFFRSALYQASLQSAQMPSVRIVFDISMDGLARKLIQVRSALMLKNELPHTVELKLENISFRVGDVKTLQVPSRSRVSVPLLYVWSRIYIKPLSLAASKGRNSPRKHSKCSWIYCRNPIQWTTLLSPRQQACEGRVCPPVQTKEVPYRFYVHVRRDNYPSDMVSQSSPSRLDLNSDGTGAQRSQDWVQPGHTIILLSPLTITNLLPFDLIYSIKSTGDEGMLKTEQDAALSSVDPEKEVFIAFWTDYLMSCGQVCIRPESAPYITRLKLTDSSARPVQLQIKVQQIYGKALKVTLFSPFWLINKTGLPIVFKQEGSSVEAAGQDTEHEVARCATPLLFSFHDLEDSPMLVARVGKSLHVNVVPHFCKKFPLTLGTRVRRLHVSYRDHRPDLVYELGVDVRMGRGRFRDTYMVTLSPRFHLDNRSSHEILISQLCFTPNASVDPEQKKTWLCAIPGCWLPFHWPRLDKDLLLCVSLQDVPDCFWSGGFLIDETNSFNINIRDSMGLSHFLRVEVLMSEATFFVVFTDTHSLPAPFRIDNFSLVPINYFQTGTQKEYLRSSVKPRFSVPYAWDEVTLPPHLTCIAPGGTSATYNLNVLGKGDQLTYGNFIYIAFIGTFTKKSDGLGDVDCEGTSLDTSDLETLRLVLDVTEGFRVRLGRKEMGRRSQLWRMTSTGMLQHEGSSPPYDPSSKKPRDNRNILVLDVTGPAPLPNEYTPLMLKKPDSRRRLTQTWRLTEDGQLCCQHLNMFVQAKDGFLGLTSGNDVVLGPPQKIDYGTLPNGIPVERAIERQRLWPGSGTLSIQVEMDGPTRVLQITDIQNKNSPQVAQTETGDLMYIKDGSFARASSLSGQSKDKTLSSHARLKNEPALEEVQVVMVLEGGIGVSVVSSPEELCYAFFSGIVFEYLSTSYFRTFDCSVRDIEVDNQLLKAQCPVVLYVSPQSKNDHLRHLPALQVTSHQLKSPNLNAFIFKHVIITMKNLTLTIEEELLCKFLVLLGLDRAQATLEKAEESEYETQRMLAAATSANATRYYFTDLELILNQVRLSVLTSKNMTPELKSIRRKLGLTLVQFENAFVNLDPFVRSHLFETSRFLIDSIRMHYESELRSQAMRILGSTDFLGNPFGLLADVSEGVQELMRDGSVGGLVMNVTHGMANSTAKVTGTLSNAVGRVTMDTQHEETRQRVLTKHLGQSPDHLVAGLMGFGLGLYGGLTSIFAQTYTGATREGVPGIFSGFFKGIVGTVTKPAIGLLDLAAGTASAVRETSKNPAHKLPMKIRKPRLVVGFTGLMPRFHERDATGQELMRLLDKSSQIFLGYEVLKEGDEDLRVIISSEQVLVFSWADEADSPTIFLRIGFRDLQCCSPIVLKWEVDSGESSYYIELVVSSELQTGVNVAASYLASLPVKRPKVRCDSHAIAVKVSEEINFAKTLYDELRQTVSPARGSDLDENQDI